MGKRQKRWSVSLRPLKAQRIKNVAAALHEAGHIDRADNMSAAIEHMGDYFAEMLGIPEETVLVPRKPKPEHEKPGPKVGHSYKAGGIFTW